MGRHTDGVQGTGSTTSQEMEARVGIDWAGTPDGVQGTGSTTSQEMEARVGIEPAYTELQSAA